MIIDINKCVEEVLEDGYCILPNHFPRPLLEQCNEDFQPILEDIARRIPDGNRGAKRWANGLAFGPPFYHSEFFNDDAATEIMSRILGEDMHISYYGMDTPTPGAEDQGIHTDIPFLFPEDPDHQHPPTNLAVRFTFVDVTEENGPFAVIPGSHHLPQEETLAKAKAGELTFTRLLLQCGDGLIVDGRAVHRGTANRSDAPRPFAVISYNRPYYSVEGEERLGANENATQLTESFYQSLSSREQHLLRRVRRTPD